MRSGGILRLVLPGFEGYEVARAFLVFSSLEISTMKTKALAPAREAFKFRQTGAACQ